MVAGEGPDRRAGTDRRPTPIRRASWSSADRRNSRSATLRSVSTWPVWNWPLGRWKTRAEFVSEHADDPRWRASILALLQSLNRRVDVERMLEAIRDRDPERTASTDRLLLLAEGAFATASVSGASGRQAALDSLRRIEAGTDDAERLELLGLALDGPRAGPIGEAIVARLGRWWPGVTEWQESLYTELGGWPPTDELAETLELALRGDRNQVAAAASLAKVFRRRWRSGGSADGARPRVREPLGDRGST